MNIAEQTHSAYQYLPGWDSEEVFDAPTQYFASMQAGIDQAQDTIELAMYIFELDMVGNVFVDCLRRAAQRGVHVRVLVDGIGSARWAPELGKQLTEAGAEFYIYHTLPWYWDGYRWSRRKDKWLQKLLYFASKINRRDHRKFLIIDGTKAWSGNFNLTADHLGRTQPWRDYGARVEGEAVGLLLENFNHVWFDKVPPKEKGDFRLYCSNASFRLRRKRNLKLAHTIRSAQERVWICSAYFSPSRTVLNAIRKARQNNIDVRLIVAGRSDIPLFPLLTSTYYADLLKMGVLTYQYEPGVLHAKVLLADNQCIIGSTNLNHRSFYHDLELDVILSHPDSIAKIEQWFLNDIENSRKVDSDDISILSRSFWFGWVPRTLRYWM